LFLSGSAESTARVTVVIASHARPEALPTVLSSLQRQTLLPREYEVSVVIDGLDQSERHYRAVLERHRSASAFVLRYVFQENAGQSVARHRAIAAATTPWICVVDDDMDLSPQFLAEHLAILHGGTSKTVVVGRVIPEDGWEKAPLYEAVRTNHMLEWHALLCRTRRQPWGHTFVTQNVAFGRDFYLEVGGFDERLRLGEDSELGLRFELAGAQFVFGDKATAIHRSRVGSYDAWLKRCVEYGRVWVYISEKLRISRAHPLRNLVNGSRLNATAVHGLCWSDDLARLGIATLRAVGVTLRTLGFVQPAIATHKAILAIAYHLGVKSALGSWHRVLEAERTFAAVTDAPHEPT
jgi:GT2 family glycosyltransferase